MKKEKIIIVSSIILIFLLCIGAISAADSDNVTSNSIDIVSSNNATDESPLTEDNSNTLSDLNNKITNDNTGNINLDENYTYSSGSDSGISDTGIVIGKDLTITGSKDSSITIDAKNSSKIFTINKGVTVTLDGLTFINANGEYGGAISNSGTLILKNCTFINNTATNRGAAVFNNGGSVDVNNTIFDGNDITARSKNIDNGGAAIFNDNGTITVTNSKITNNIKNIVPRNGSKGDFIDAAICSLGGTTTINNTIFTNNSGCYGAGIYIGPKSTTNGNLNVNNCTFTNNTALFGNGIFLDYNTIATINNSNFKNNKANGIGSPGTNANSGAAISTSRHKELTITNTNFTNNTAKEGGAIKADGGITKINNCTFTNNTATDIAGALIINNKGKAQITNTNFTNNTAYNAGGALYDDTNETIYQENNTYTNNTPTNIGSKKYNLGISVDNISYNENAEIKIALTDKNNNTLSQSITVIVNGNEYEVDVTDGNGVLTLNNLASGKYTVIASLKSNNTELTSKYAEFTVRKATPAITVTGADISYGNDETVTVTLTGVNNTGLNDTITLTINNTEYNITTIDGVGSAVISNLSAGTYNVNVVYIGNDNYTSTNGKSEFEVSPMATKLNVDFDSKANIIVRLVDANGNPISNANISYLINNTEVIPVLVTDENGNAQINDLTGNNYITLIYGGNNNYLGTNSSKYVVMVPKPERIASQIISSDFKQTAVDYYKGERGGYFVVALKDSEGNALAGKHISIGFNGKVYNRTTDENGSARLQINLANAGVYTFATAFLGDDECNGSFVVNKITVTKKSSIITVKGTQPVKVRSYRTLTFNLKGVKAIDKSSYVNAIGRTLKVTVNGKTYTLKTDKNGKATLKVRFTRTGTYTIKTAFAGDGTFNAKTMNSKITVRR
ncbi:Ig-like domain-containing protein [uncultured Methanobrevibacter sp.]|uniref:Ig-like domain-containing protein n=1 Tax=uncultured Methanobrevibacter sp. TaxID=253161 RepID=UPI00258C8FEE|nr:Ig-like domain-containing protein [uncultured Methanobrevibacter sp.]